MIDETNPLKVYTRENSLKWEQKSELDKPRQYILDRVIELSRVGGTTLLDIGCGTGRWTRKFAEHLENVVGLDASPEMIKIAKEKNPAENIEYFEGDILSSYEGKYDIVTCLAMLHCTKDRKELNRLYEQVIKHTKRFSSFLFYVPHPMAVFTNLSRTAHSEFDSDMCYQDNFPYTTTIQLGNGETRQGEGYHHTIEEYVRDLTEHGFVIWDMKEISVKNDKIPFALVVDGFRLKE